MCTELLFYTIQFLLFSNVYCIENDFVFTEAELHEVHPLKYIFLFGSILIFAIIHHLFRVYNVFISYSVFATFLGMIWGAGANYNPWMNKMCELSTYLLHNFYEIYLPPIIYSVALFLDIHAFFKSLSQLVIISVPMLLINAIMNGFFMVQILITTNIPMDAMIYGITTAAVFSFDVVHLLCEATVHPKQVIILLEGETMLSAATVVCVYEMLKYKVQGLMVYWYQFIMVVIRMVLGGMSLGYMIGLGGTALMKLAYKDVSNLMLLTISMCYISFYIGEYIANAGIVTNMITGIVMSKERPSLSKEVDQSLNNLWSMIIIIMNGITYTLIGSTASIRFFEAAIPVNEYFIVFVTYLGVNMTRFITFLTFSWILSRIGYGISFQNMIVCVWGGLKSPLCVFLAWKFSEIEKTQTLKADIFFMHVFGIYLLMLLVNTSIVRVLLKTIGLSEISTFRQINMNSCMNYIYEARGRMVAILKMDRYFTCFTCLLRFSRNNLFWLFLRLLSDANWPLVMNTTALKHPYNKIASVENAGNQEDFFMGYRFTYCPDCEKNIPKKATPKEMKEMTREAKMRVLKHKKTTYSRQYENGMISKEGARILLQAVEVAMDSDQLIIELDELLQMFSTEEKHANHLRKKLQIFVNKMKHENIRQPKQKWMFWCYSIANHIAYRILMNFVVLTNLIIVIYHAIVCYKRDTLPPYLFVSSNIFFFLLYLAEFWIKIFAYSLTSICPQGVQSYFRSSWNLVEFIILVSSSSSIVLNIVAPKTMFDQWYLNIILHIFLVVRLFRIPSYLKLSNLCKKAANEWVKHLSLITERNKALAYELGKNYIDGEDEILQNLEQIIDNDTIREQLRQKVEEDSLCVARKLGVEQMEAPWVTTLVKTKTAIRTILNSIRDDIVEMKVSGWVDDGEYNKLQSSLSEQYKFINTINTVTPASPKLIFEEVPFLSGEREIIDFLYSNVCTRKFDPGNIVIGQGDIVEGIYIVITGLFRVTYLPSKSVSDKLYEIGAMPIIDNTCSTTYTKEMSTFAMPGNTIGVLSAITSRPYDGTVTSETHSEVYLLKDHIVKQAMMMDADPVEGLECRIWKALVFTKAVSILANTPSYKSYTQEKIKFIVERAFVPNLSNYKIFEVNQMMQDIILLEGIVVDYNTRDVYIAPCHVPRSVQKLFLPASSLVNMDVAINTKLMVIPAKDFNEYEIMMTEELTCQLVDETSTKCLRHFIQDRKEQSGSSKMRSLMKHLRKSAIRVESERSKITFATSATSRLSKPSKSVLATKSTLRDASKYRV